VNATGVTASPAESNGKLLLGIWRDSLHVTGGLTACTPGSAPGRTLGNEYGKTLPLFYRNGAEPRSNDGQKLTKILLQNWLRHSCVIVLFYISTRVGAIQAKRQARIDSHHSGALDRHVIVAIVSAIPVSVSTPTECPIDEEIRCLRRLTP